MPLTKKDRMGSAEHEGKLLTCSMGTQWPPVEVTAYGSLEEALSRVSEETKQRLRVWEKLCGISRIDPLKCAKCELVLVDGIPTPPKQGVRRGVAISARSPLLNRGNPGKRR